MRCGMKPGGGGGMVVAEGWIRGAGYHYYRIILSFLENSAKLQTATMTTTEAKTLGRLLF